jgi:hypothetical protein
MGRAAVPPGQSGRNGHPRARNEGAERPSLVLPVDGMVAEGLAVLKVVKVVKVVKRPVVHRRQAVTMARSLG